MQHTHILFYTCDGILRFEFVIESCLENLHATLRSVERWSNIIRERFWETQEQAVRIWKIPRLNMRATENIHAALVCHMRITMLGKPPFGNDQIWQKRWTTEDQTRAHLDTPSLIHEP